MSPDETDILRGACYSVTARNCDMNMIHPPPPKRPWKCDLEGVFFFVSSDERIEGTGKMLQRQKATYLFTWVLRQKNRSEGHRWDQHWTQDINSYGKPPSTGCYHGEDLIMKVLMPRDINTTTSIKKYSDVDAGIKWSTQWRQTRNRELLKHPSAGACPVTKSYST